MVICFSVLPQDAHVFSSSLPLLSLGRNLCAFFCSLGLNTIFVYFSALLDLKQFCLFGFNAFSIRIFCSLVHLDSMRSCYIHLVDISPTAVPIWCRESNKKQLPVTISHWFSSINNFYFFRKRVLCKRHVQSYWLILLTDHDHGPISQAYLNDDAQSCTGNMGHCVTSKFAWLMIQSLNIT